MQVCRMLIVIDDINMLILSCFYNNLDIRSPMVKLKKY